MKSKSKMQIDTLIACLQRLKDQISNIEVSCCISPCDGHKIFTVTFMLKDSERRKDVVSADGGIVMTDSVTERRNNGDTVTLRETK